MSKAFCPICGDNVYRDKKTCGVPGCIEKYDLTQTVWQESSQSKELGNMLDEVDPDNKLNGCVIEKIMMWTIIELSRNEMLVNKDGDII